MSEYIVDVGNADEEYIEHFGHMATAYADNPIRELIVRCRNCKYLDITRGSLVPRVGICMATCTRLGTQIPWQDIDSGFCSWAERREQ